MQRALYPLSLHDALPISDLIAHRLEGRPDVRASRLVLAEDVVMAEGELEEAETVGPAAAGLLGAAVAGEAGDHGDRKSTRLNSSHGSSSYAVFCLKKKKQ